jgi:hypothetical protein
MRYRTAGPNVAKQACRTIQAEGAWGQAREEQVQGDIAGPLSVSVIIVEKGPSIQFLNRKKGDDSGHSLGPGGQIPGGSEQERPSSATGGLSTRVPERTGDWWTSHQ